MTRTRLEIRCTGRKVNPLNNRPYGRTCNQVFTSAGPYRSRNDWLERAPRRRLARITPASRQDRQRVLPGLLSRQETGEEHRYEVEWWTGQADRTDVVDQTRNSPVDISTGWCRVVYRWTA